GKRDPQVRSTLGVSLLRAGSQTGSEQGNKKQEGEKRGILG
ncbi:hypothetical protein Tco_0562916, partial [Tanacetum coccineum]